MSLCSGDDRGSIWLSAFFATIFLSDLLLKANVVFNRNEAEARLLLIINEEGVVRQSSSNIFTLEFFLIAIEFCWLFLRMWVLFFFVEQDGLFLVG